MGLCYSSNDNKTLTNYNQPQVKIQSVLTGFKFNKAFYRGDLQEETKAQININFEPVGKGVGRPLENYSIERTIFESATEAVLLARHKLTQTFRTMKIINKDTSNDESEKLIIYQIDVLKKIDHPNIIKVFEFYNEKDQLYIIQEHGNGGELLDYIAENSPINEFTSAYIIYQILCAVYYGHNSNIFHLDLKPENIIIDYIDSDIVHIKVMDFGCSQIIENQITKKTKSMPMSSIYFASPEALEGRFSSNSDLWSIGVILYLLLSERVPFMGEKEDEVKEKIHRGSFDLRDYPWNKISKEGKDLIKKLIVNNPDNRIKLRDALDHIWFKKLNLKERALYIEKDVLLKQINNLRGYSQHISLQDAVLSFLIHNSLHLPQMRDSCKMFDLFDANNDGVITVDDMEYGINKVFNTDKSREMAEEIIDNIGKGGCIEFEQFIKACVDKERLLGEDILRYAFNYFDKDKSGDITVEELKQAFFGDRGNSKEDYELIEKMMKEVDEDGNGEIDFNEFVKIMQSILDH